MLLPASPAFAAPTLTITPLTWDVIGLDSNRPQTATNPNLYPSRFKVCNTDASSAAPSTSLLWTWGTDNHSGQQKIDFQTTPGATKTVSLGTIAASSCKIASYLVEVTQAKTSIGQYREYSLAASATGATTVNLTGRELWVESLVSQNRNAIISTVWKSLTDGTNPCTSATVCSVKEGQRYTITLTGKTSTSYNQIQQFLTLPDNIMTIDSIKTTFATPANTSVNQEYGDGCGWAGPTTTSSGTCDGAPAPQISGGKAGGNPIKTVYTVTINNNASTQTAAPIYPMITDNSGSSFHYNTDAATKEITLTAKKAADLSITKTHANNASSSAFIQNTTGTTSLGNRYVLTVTNNGPTATAGTITVTDTLPSGLTIPASTLIGSSGATFTNSTAATNGCPVTTAGASAVTSISCSTTTSIASGGTATLTLPIAVPSGQAKGQVANTATVAISTGATDSVDANTANNSSTDNATIAGPPDADLIVTNTHTGNFTRGGTATWTLTLKNDGPQAVNSPQIVDTLPAGITYTGFTGTDWSCNAVGQVVTCTYSQSLASGATATTLQISGTVESSAADTVTNSATGTATGTDPNSLNNTNITDRAVVGQADMSLAISHSGSFTVPSSNGTFTFAVSNAGPDAASSPSIVFTLPAKMTYVSVGGATGWSCSGVPASPTTSQAQVVTCTRSTSVLSGATSNVIITVAVDSSTADATAFPISGIACSGTVQTTTIGAETVYSCPVLGGSGFATYDPDTTFNSSEDSVQAYVGADMGVTITPSSTVAAGNSVIYTVTVSNAGPNAATNPFFLVTLPTGFTCNTGTASACVGTLSAPYATSGGTPTLNTTNFDNNCSTSAQEVICPPSGVTTLASGQSYQATLTAATSTTVTPTGASTIPVITAADQGDTSTTNNSASVVTTITGGNSAPAVVVTFGGSATTAVNESSTNTYTYDWSASDSGGDTISSFVAACGDSGTKVGGDTITSGGTGTASIAGTFVCKFDDGTLTSLVTVNATDNRSLTGTGTNTVTITNVAPTGVISAPTSATTSTNFTLALNSGADVSAADTTDGFDYEFDCGSGTYGDIGSVSSTTCTAPSSAGSVTVKARITDKNGGATEYTQSVTINGAPTADATSASLSHKSADGVDVTLTGQDTTGANLTFSIVSGPAIGTLGSITGTNCTGTTTKTCTATVHYSNPGTDTLGNTSFTYKATRSGPVDSSAATATITRTNAAPTATVALSPASVTTNSTLTATATKTDADGDTTTLTYVWKVTRAGNTCTVKTTSGSSGLTDTLDLGASHSTSSCTGTDPGTLNPARDDLVEVFVTPSDGHVSGTQVTASKTVGNTAPTATVSLNTAAPQTNDTLTATATKSDTDGDTVTLTYTWKVTKGNSTCTLKTTSASSSLTDTLNLSSSFTTSGCTGSDLTNGTSYSPSKADVVTVEVTPNDGTDNGTMVSAAATIANTAPTATVDLDPNAPLTNDTLTATATKADADGDTVTLTYVWKVTKGNSTCTLKTTSGSSSLTDTLNLGSSFTTGACTGSDLTNGTSYNPSTTDVITVQVTPHDGTVSGSTVSDTATIVNTAPTATVDLDPNAPLTNDTLTATATKSDVDGDTVTLTYTWKVTKGNSTCTLKTTSGSSSLTDTLNLGSSFTTGACTGSDLTNGTSYNPSKTDVITVQVTPHDGTVSGSTVSDTATIGNATPVATDQINGDKASVDEDGTRTITLAGTDSDSDTLTFKITSLPSNGNLYDGPDASGHLITTSEASSGYTVTDASKRVTFVPTANYNNGPSAFGPSFTFTVTDPGTATDAGTVQIDVDPVNDAPTWDATITMGSGGSLDLSTVSADLETGDSNLAYTFVGTDGGATKGTPTITGQTLTYVRDGGETGTDTVTVRVTDRGDPDNCGSGVAGACTTALNSTKAITINLDNETPVATPQTGGSKVTTNEDTNKVITLAGTDADLDDLTFKITSVPSNGKLYKGASTAGADEITSASSGSPVTLAGTTVTFVPTANYNNGSSAFGSSFTFTASDVTDTSAAATVQIDVDPVNDAPVAADTGITTSSGTSSVNLVTLTTDIETTAGTHVYKVTSLPAAGTLKDGATTISSVPYTMTNGTTVTYTQPANYNTDVSFTYSATDRGDPDNCGSVQGGACTAALTDSGTISVDVTNAAPTAGGQTLATNEDTSKLITLTGTDPETDTLTFKITALPTNGVLMDGTTTITSGLLPRTLSGALSFVPATNHNSGVGSPESFTFKSNDTFSDSANATVTIDVDPVNDTPTWDASVGVGAAGSLDLQTVSADIETLDANLAYSIVTNGTKGTATLTGSTLTYSQSPNKNGTDTITVRVTDRGDPDNCGTVVAGACTAALTADKDVTITLVQTAPVATGQTGGSKIVIDEDDTGELITFAGTDAQSDTITFKVTTLPTNGKLYIGNSTATADEIESADLPATTGSVTFVPTADYNNGSSAFGPSFTFSATDALGSNSAGSGTVQIDVNPLNDQPTWNATVSMGESASLNLRNASADVETADADLTYSIVTNGTKGTATLTGATLTYAKTAGQTGTDSVTVRVTDRGDPDNCGSVVAGACTAAKTADKTVSVSLDAAPVNNPPTATVTLHTLPNTGEAAVLTSTQAPKTNDKVRATASCGDVDGDNVTLTFVWKVTRLDNSVVTVQTTTVSAGTCSGTFTDTLDLSKTGFGDKGETVKVEVTPNDATIDGTTATGSTTVVVSDTPPTATDRVVKTGVAQAKTIVLEGSDIDGESVSFGITQQPTTGTLVVAADSTKNCFVANGTSGTRGSYTSPGTETCHLNATYTPAGGVTGSVTFKYKVENSAAASRIATVTVEIEANPQTGTKQTDDAEQETVQGALVSTGSAPSTDDPVETQIVAVRNGRIIIKEEPVDETPPSGFSYFAQQIDIQVLDGNDDPVTTTASEPQRFSFLLDPSMLPTGKTVSDIRIYRNGTELSACTGGSDLVQPTPACVLSRTLASGKIQIEVLTTAASTWHFAVPVPVSGGGGGGAPAPTPTPTPEPTDPPDPTVEPEAPLATLKIHNPKLVRGSMLHLTGKLRVCPGHEGTLLHLTAKIDGTTTAKTLQIKKVDDTCHVDYQLRANFKRALFNVYWPSQDDDHHRGIGVPHWAVTHRLPGPLAVLWIDDHTPERGQLLTIFGWLRRCPGHGQTKMHLVARIDGAKQAELISVKTLDGRCRAEWKVRADFDQAIFNVRWPKQHHDHAKGNGRPHVVVTHKAV